MALPFLNNPRAKRDSIIAVDLGGRTTKAVHLHKKGDKFVLSGYALLDAPIYEKSLSAEMLAEHLKSVCQTLNARTKLLALTIGVNDSLVRHVELPVMPVDDMRQVLRMNSKNYLQQDFGNHVFDCFAAAARPKAGAPAEPVAKPQAGSPKQRVLVGGAKRQLVDDLQEAAKSAGLIADAIVPSLIGPINAFELAMPEVFAKENVALIDLGFKNTTISILQEGDLALSRTVAIGGDKLTATLAEAMGISYAEADGIKVGMPTEVQPHLESIVTTLGRELRASVDYFEHQSDRAVSQVFVSGAASGSQTILQLLQAELMAECKTWNPACLAQLALPAHQMAELEMVSHQLPVALGAAVTSL
ncbi:MAG: PilM: type pilus assembly protein [Verrucomicrobiota bacterium]|jgi:type IV pilus assembly protein PilM